MRAYSFIRHCSMCQSLSRLKAVRIVQYDFTRYACVHTLLFVIVQCVNHCLGSDVYRWSTENLTTFASPAVAFPVPLAGTQFQCPIPAVLVARSTP